MSWTYRKLEARQGVIMDCPIYEVYDEDGGGEICTTLDESKAKQIVREHNMTCDKCKCADQIVAGLPHNLCPKCLCRYVSELERFTEGFVFLSGALHDRMEAVFDAMIAIGSPWAALHVLASEAEKMPTFGTRSEKEGAA